MKRTHVDLFSGIGGFSLACEWAGVETIAFAEIDDYASRVLQRHWPTVRNYGDVRSVPAIESTWLVTAGVPCQPASVAGRRRGAEDDRWLWPEALAAVERIRPAWALFENPTGILSLNDGVEFECICTALESQSYEVQPIVIPACAVGAPHRRDRLWIIAHSTQGGRDEPGLSIRPRRQSKAAPEPCRNSTVSSNGTRIGRHETQAPDSLAGGPQLQGKVGGFSRGAIRSPWLPEPGICRVVDGLSPDMVAAIGGFGNAIVPQVAYQLIKRMIEAEDNQ